VTRPPMQLSNSRIKALFCAWMFQQRYVHGCGDYTSTPAYKGRVLHKLAEDYIAHLNRSRRTRDMDWYTDRILKAVESEPPHIAQDILDVGEMFVTAFRLDKRADSHQTELTLAVNRKYEPVEVELDDDGNVVNLTEDIITGRLDYQAVYKRGKRSEIWDFKMGEEHLGPGAASANPQLQLYAALDFWHHPEREAVDIKLWGVKYGFKNSADYRYTREHATTEAQRRCEWAFRKLDALYDLLADNPWPVQPDVPGTCQWCSVCDRCPRNVALLPLVFQTPLAILTSRKKNAA